MRRTLILLSGLLAACGGGVTVPNETIVYEVPGEGVASTAGPGDFQSQIEAALDEPSAADPFGAPGAAATSAPPTAGTRIDDDRLNLNEFSLEQQRIDAAIAERELAEARRQLVVVPPTAAPAQASEANIALYAQRTTNAVGERIYRRGVGLTGGRCGRYATPDDAQRAFLGAGGPEVDRFGLDPDGDGFACRWDPTPYRQLRL